MAELMTCGSVCNVCGNIAQFRCSRCHKSYYCGTPHQKSDWKSHKKNCLTTVYSSDETISKKRQRISEEKYMFPLLCLATEQMYILNKKDFNTLGNLSLQCVDLLQNIGFCIIENITSDIILDGAIREIVLFYQKPGFFSAGLLSTSVAGSDEGQEEPVRSDCVAWLTGKQDSMPFIYSVVEEIDKLVMCCSPLEKFETCDIKSRSKPVLTCFPGNGTHYKNHVDNPCADGRKLTTICYFNKNYRSCDGGVLRIHKETSASRSFDIEPKYGRVIMFWSDKRTLHEVLPSFKTRFALTLWYYDANERTLSGKRSMQDAHDKILPGCAFAPT